MNKLFILLYSLVLCGLLSCNGAGKTSEMIKAIEKTDSCKADPNNTYEVYIPARNNADEKLPLLVIIDAHGSGKFALNKFKQGADQYPAIIVASDFIKNGFVNYTGAIQTLIEDVRQKYPAGETLFMSGFSGGARMTLEYGINHQLNGVILCGALANAGQIHALSCPVISISGMDDFNFIETAQYLFQEQLAPGNLKIELTNASHNWPDSQMLTNAFGFLWLSRQTTDIPVPTKSQLDDYCKNQQKRIDSLKNQGDWLKATLIAWNMSSTAPFNSDKTFASIYKSLKSSSDYASQMSQLRNSLNTEIKARQPYINAFTTKDSMWWKNEIRIINKRIETEQDSFTVEMYRRIKGFLGIACYSLGNQDIKVKNTEKLNKIVPVYRMLEPENPYVFYFSAFPYFWKGNSQATISLLKKALDEGFTDISQLKTDFPESITSKLDLKNN